MLALWAAWIISAIALFVNQIVFHGSGIGPGLATGVVALVIQAIVLIAIARGSSAARWVAVFFLALAALTLQIVGRLVTERSFWSAGYTVVGFALKAIGVFMLFTGDAGRWFSADRPGMFARGEPSSRRD